MRKNKKAFTLVELLVVISIIALLMAIMMPSLARVKNQAQALVCRNNLRQWGLFWNFYLQNTDNRFFRQMGMQGGSGVWLDAIRTYWDENPDLWCCPTATIPGQNEDGVGTGIDGPFRAWGIFDGGYWTTEGDYGSYGINAYVNDAPDPTIIYGEGGPGSNFWRYANVKGADKAPLMLDSVWIDGWPKHTDIPPVEWKNATQPQMTRYILNRHLGFTNGVFLDMSVKKIGLKALWRLKWHRTFDINYAYDDKTFFTGSFVNNLPNVIE